MVEIGDNLILEYVPEDAYDFKLTNYKKHTVLNYSYKINNNIANVGINDGEFNVILNEAKILDKLSELSEEECQKFVKVDYPFDGQYIKMYKNYSSVPLEPWGINTFFKTPKESLISLLQSHGIDTSKPNTILLIEKL